MRSSSEILDFLDTKSMVKLDGAMGTELERRGYRTVLPSWSAMANIESPELVKKIHMDYIRAGADIITTNTFRTTRYTFKKINREMEAKKIFFAAIELANDAVKNSSHVLIAGSIAPLEDCYRPDLVPDSERLTAYHTTTIQWFLDSQVDFILLETMNNSREAKILCKLLSEGSIPFMVSFITGNPGHLLSGESLESAIKNIAGYEPLAVLLNCRPPEELSRGLLHLQTNFPGITGIYANGKGEPDPEVGWKWDSKSWRRDYLSFVREWHQAGVKIIGGCCGTDPGIINDISRLVRRSDLN